MLNKVRAFWWSPRQDLRSFLPEARDSFVLWAKLAGGQGRFMANFGDEFTKYALESVLRRPVVWSSPGKADIVAIGSIIELVLARSEENLFWGTGLRHPSSEKDYSDIGRSTFLAVRGPITAAELQLSPSTVTGDPGLLIRNWVDPKTTSKKLGKKIYIPHFRTWATAEGRNFIRFARESNFDVIPPTLDPIEIGNHIASAELVMTSSLHGIVFAHALGTNLLVLEPAHLEPEFKYLDYFHSLDLAYKPIKLVSVRDELQKGRFLEQSETDNITAFKASESKLQGLIQALEAQGI